MQTAGSDKTKATPPLAGPTTSDDSRSLPPTVTPDSLTKAIVQGSAAEGADVNSVKNWSDLTPAEKAEAEQAMVWMNVSRKRAQKILRNAGGGKYLRRGMASALALNYQISGLEEGERALRFCRTKMKDPNMRGADVAQIVKAVPAIMASIARLTEAAIAAAQKLDDVAKPVVLSQSAPVQVGVSIQNFPPMAPMPQRANAGPILDQDDGDKRG